MAYHVVDPTGIDPASGIPGDHRYLNDAVDLASFTIQVVEADPGESFAPYHTHGEQEEVFYVLSGELSVTTPEADYTIEPGSFFVAEPGSPLHPHNPADADEPVRALLVNAPRADDFELYDPDE